MKIILKLIREFYATGANLEAFVKSLIKQLFRYQQPENSLSEGSELWQTRLEGNIFLANLHEGV